MGKLIRHITCTFANFIDRAFRLIQSAGCRVGLICNWREVHSMIRYDKLAKTCKWLFRECPEQVNKMDSNSGVKSLIIKLGSSVALQVIKPRRKLIRKASAIVLRRVGAT